MKKFYLLFFFFTICTFISAQDGLEWFRYAAISPDGNNIAFTFKGDIYVVSSAGGNAQPVTFHQAHDYNPVWSHDGKKLAFASNRFGNFDVFVVDAQGGDPLRLTYHSNPEIPFTFTADDKSVIFGGHRLDAVTHRQYPTNSQPEVYQVPIEGGRVTQLWTIPAEDIKVSKDGNHFIYHDKKGGENTWRKHHVSSITRDIWLYDKTKDSHTMITSFKGEDRNPVFVDDEKSIYYLSEESGSFNVHKLSLENPANKTQITFFKMYPVRFLSVANTGMLCYTFNGELYTQIPQEQPIKVNVSIRTESKINNQLIIPVSGNISEMSVSPNGKEVAYIVRGEIFVSSVEGGITKRITNTPGQERFVSFSPDGSAILYSSERDGKWIICQTKKVRTEEPYFYVSTLLEETILISNEKHNYQPQYSPDGKEIGFIEDLRSLRIINMASRQVRTLLTPGELFYMSDGDQYFKWSPDGKWIIACYSPQMSNSEIIIMAADGSGKMFNLTESGYGDFQPKWVNKGKQMLWFSDRDGMRSYANSGSRQLDVYTMFFTKDGLDRYNLSKEESALLKEIEDKAEKEKKEKEEKAKKDNKNKKITEVKNDTSLIINWDGLKDRKVRLTIHSSTLADALLSKDGEKLYYLAKFEKGYNLWSCVLRTKETKKELDLNAQNGSLYWDKDMKNIFLLADGKISKINPETMKQDNIEIKGELNLDIAAEREQMFEHVWNRTKSMFYISTFHGAPWDELKISYQKKLPSIGNGFEFAELLSEMLGELNVSHSGANYSNTDPNGDFTAGLGIFIDYDYTADGIKIAEVIKEGPLDKENIKISAGMIIEQIDGEVITAKVDAAKFLNRKADKYTSLLVYDPVTKTRQQVTVKPISVDNENRLIYKRWVRANQDEVNKLSNGQLGYVHITDMNDGPYRNVYEDVMGKYSDRKGLVVDTRFNRGGDLVSDLAMFFTGKKFLDYGTEARSLGIEPPFRWTKPTVAMVNEANYSDGHCFACGYQDLGIGKLIGMPVPGTCSFAGWELLQDGSVTWGAIPVSTKNIKGEWLENKETVPEFQIKNDPGIISKGRDQQLEKAIEELLKVIK